MIKKKSTSSQTNSSVSTDGINSSNRVALFSIEPPNPENVEQLFQTFRCPVLMETSQLVVMHIPILFEQVAARIGGYAQAALGQYRYWAANVANSTITMQTYCRAPFSVPIMFFNTPVTNINVFYPNRLGTLKKATYGWMSPLFGGSEAKKENPPTSSESENKTEVTPPSSSSSSSSSAEGGGSSSSSSSSSNIKSTSRRNVLEKLVNHGGSLQEIKDMDIQRSVAERQCPLHRIWEIMSDTPEPGEQEKPTSLICVPSITDPVRISYMVPVVAPRSSWQEIADEKWEWYGATHDQLLYCTDTGSFLHVTSQRVRTSGTSSEPLAIYADRMYGMLRFALIVPAA